MVALKRQAARTAQAQRTRSRNAVVALKPPAQTDLTGGGGRSRNAVVALKLRKPVLLGSLHPRSRNAVVALKLAAQAVARTWPQHAWKQERRGGIETLVPGPRGHPLRSGSRNAVVALKRDGRATGGRPGQPEAGTPWWH